MAIFVSGTKTIFKQTTAPTGWTKITDYDDHALRVVSGAVGTGGSVNFSTVHTPQAWTGSINGTTDSFTLTTNEIPSHSHTVWVRAGPSSLRRVSPSTFPRTPNSTNVSAVSSLTGGGQGHAHPVQIGFTAANIDLSVSYCDIIIASKD